MGRRWLVVAAFAALCQLALAVPALPGLYRHTQPDGTVIMLRQHGDEWYHWTTDESGRTMTLDAEGFYRYARVDHRAGMARARQMRARADALRATRRVSSALTQGTRRIPVLLIEYTDTHFTVSDPASAFSDLLNKEGYSVDGAYGSVRDYYVDNSDGKFTPVFDVFGPVEVSGPSSKYDPDPPGLLHEAAALLDGDIDFSRYDSDGDGVVDMILFYFAGYNEAEGGSEDTIWPHQGYAWQDTQYDGKRLGTYFCTSELRWASGSQMCAIGTTCHEFAHSLGLPDFYDTDGSDGIDAGGLYEFSLMSSGNYNDNSRRPPRLNAIEREMLGWMDGSRILEISVSGNYTVPPIQDNIAYKTLTATEGEFFLYECRDGSSWDKPLPAGLCVYQVDQSGREVRDDYRAIDLWTSWEQSNIINGYGLHPCFRLVPAYDPQILGTNVAGAQAMVFPGKRNITSYSPVDWEGDATGIRLSQIIYSSYVSMNVTVTNMKGIKGIVTGSDGAGLSGATVRVGSASAVTDASGAYTLSLLSAPDGPAEVRVSRSGYQEVTATVTLDRFTHRHNFVLLKAGETPVETLQKYYSGIGIVFGIGTNDIQEAVLFTQQELAAHVGKRLMSVDVYYPETSAEWAQVIVDEGPYYNPKRLLSVPVTLSKGMNRFDVSGEGFYIPSGKDLFFGLSLKGGSSQFVLAGDYEVEYIPGGGYVSYNDGSTFWMDLDDVNLHISVNVKADDTPVENPSWLFPWIDNPGEGKYKAGSVLALELHEGAEPPVSVAWSMDGVSVPATSLRLGAGTHLIQALLTYADGSTELLELAITAE